MKSRWNPANMNWKGELMKSRWNPANMKVAKGTGIKQCENCATYKAGLCYWYNFGDRCPPKMFSPADKCLAFREELANDEVCLECKFYISVGGHLGECKGYCVVDGELLPSGPIPEEVRARAYLAPGLYACTPEYMEYAMPGFYGYDQSTIKGKVGLDHCDRFEGQQKTKRRYNIAFVEKMTFLENLMGRPKARLCNGCGAKIQPKQSQGGFDYICPEHGLFLVIRKGGKK